MAITAYNIVKWSKMILGTSVEYVHQPIGKFFKTDGIGGYYNDLREKVTKDHVQIGGLPDDSKTKKVTTFPTQIFQYGLGCFDCYLDTKNKDFLKSFFSAVSWALRYQNNDGSWTLLPQEGIQYGSMAQGEGISLLCRAMTLRKDASYLVAIEKAYNFLINQTAEHRSNGLVVYHEFDRLPVVFNGMIFSMFGLFDYWLLTRSETSLSKWKESVDSLKKITPFFDTPHWCLYSEDGKFVSKFYFLLHISLFEAMYALTNDAFFDDYIKKWRKDLKQPLNRTIYFWKKAYQKIKE